jgi:hypothetical protein
MSIWPENKRPKIPAIPLCAVAIGFKQLGASEKVRWCVGMLTFGFAESVSLYYNAAVYVRLTLPGIWIHIRWAGRDATKREYFQCGVGFNMHGILDGVFRFKSDFDSAQGETGPNVGQAFGWMYGTK